MRRHVLLAIIGLLSLTSASVTHAADTQTKGVENAALRCSAITLMHSTLTIPSPQFGEVMGEIAGLFAQIYVVQQEARTKNRLNAAEIRKRRDVVLSEISKGWPKNKTTVIRDAAICNLWRIEFFSKLSEKPNEKEFQSAIATLGPPPGTVSKPDIDKWTGLTPQAIDMWSKIQTQKK